MLEAWVEVWLKKRVRRIEWRVSDFGVPGKPEDQIREEGGSLWVEKGKNRRRGKGEWESVSIRTEKGIR